MDRKSNVVPAVGKTKGDMPWSEEAALLQSQADHRELYEQLKIDKHDLDTAWEQQPDLFAKISDHLSDASSMRDQAKMAVDQKAAEVELDIRRDWDSEVEKITEGAIKARVAISDKLKGPQTRYYAWKALSDKWSNLKSAFDQRKDALKGLSSLFVAGYFTTTSFKTGMGDVRNRQAADIKAGLAEKRRQGN